MTLYEIDTAVLTEIGEDPTDDAVRAQWADLLLLEHNNTYIDICRRFIHPRTQEQVTLDGDRKFKTAGAGAVLTYGCAKVLAVKAHQDYSEDAGGRPAQEYAFEEVGPEEYIVPGAAAGSDVWVSYEYLPDKMTDSTEESADVPGLVPEQYHQAFVFNGVAAIRRSRGMFQSMQMYQTLAENVMTSLVKRNQQTRAGSIWGRRGLIHRKPDFMT
jgi:hypothetical protein